MASTRQPHGDAALATLDAQVVQRLPGSSQGRLVLPAAGDACGAELVLEPDRLSWYAAGLLQLSFPVQGEVLQAAFCSFRRGEQPQLCVLQPRLLRVFATDGETHTLPLPSPFTQLFPLEAGLLLAGCQECAPKVLPLPEEDLQPVPTEARSHLGGAWGEAGQAWAHDDVVWAGGSEAPFALTFHRKTRHLRLWQRREGPAARGGGAAELAWRTPQQAKLQRQALASPASGSGVKRPSIRLPNGALSPAVFSPVPMTASGGPLPPVMLLPPAPLPFSLALLAEQPAPDGERLTSGVLFHDLDGSRLLALHCAASQQLTAVRLPPADAPTRPSGLEVVFRCEAAAAVAVARQPLCPSAQQQRPCSLLVLRPDGGLRLHAGASLAFSVVLPPPQPADGSAAGAAQPATPGRRPAAAAAASPLSDVSMDVSEASPSPQQRPAVAAAASALGSVAVTGLQAGPEGDAILATTGGCRLRVRPDFLPPCKLLCACFAALRWRLPPGALAQLVQHWHALPGCCADSPDAQWAAFAAALLNWASCALPQPASVSTLLQAGAGGGAWAALQASEQHRGRALSGRFPWLRASSETGPEAAAAASNSSGAVAPCALEALEVLHALYEDCKLHVRRLRWLPLLAQLLLRLAAATGAHAYAAAYAAELGPARPAPQLPPSPAAGGRAPASMHAALSALLLGLAPEPWLPPPLLPGAGAAPAFLARSAEALHVVRVLAQTAAEASDREPGLPADAAILNRGAQRLVLAMVERGWGLAQLTTLPFGLQLPLREAIARCRRQPPQGWPLEAYQLVGRADLVANASQGPSAGERPPAEAAAEAAAGSELARRALAKPPKGPRRASLLGPAAPATPLQGVPQQQQPRPRQSTGTEAAAAASPSAAPLNSSGSVPYAQAVLRTGVDWTPESGEAEPAQAADGMASLEAAQRQQRFGPNLSLAEVRRLLQSAKPTPIHIKSSGSVADAELVQLQQKRLMALAVRTMALPLGRAALTLGTLAPLPTEPLDIPALNLAGTLPQQQHAVVKLDLTATTPAPGGGAAADFTAWPEFHNGVAAGMRLAPGGAQLTRTWIVYNKPKEPSYTHAGMLMGLGLTGHLTCLAATDLFRYLSQEHDATTAGVLLGMAAARRGSCDAATSKMLFLHVPMRHPAAYPELELSPLVQAAALLGVGLLHQGSCRRLTAEIMLEEIGRRPGGGGGGPKAASATSSGGTTIAADRESYALAAGLALGLICLGHGRAAAGLADMRIEERLRFYMVGGKDPRLASRSGKHLESPAAAGGGGGSGEPGAIGFDPTLGGEMPWGQPGVSPRDRGAGSNVPTAPQGHSQLVIEGDVANLDVTAPAATLALGLMYLMTNDAGVAAAFAVPATHFELDLVRPDFIMLRVLARALVMWDSVRADEAWLLSNLPPLLKGPLEEVGWGPAGMPACGAAELPEDPEAIAQAHVNALTGACLAVGIRYAGTADMLACDTLTRYLTRFLRAKLDAPDPFSGAAAVWGRLDKQTLENCLDVIAIALSLVMAGTGHLPTFKLLRGLRRRLSQGTSNTAGAVFFGNHMAVSMALGFLFYGGGSRTLATTKPAVAALVISLFPRFPLSPTDNRCHLQAFRHLHVLASEPRCVEALDVGSRQPRRVPLTAHTNARRPASFTFGRPGEVKLETPCLLPELASVERLDVQSPEHFPLSIARPSPAFEGVLRTGRLFVQAALGSGDATAPDAPASLAPDAAEGAAAELAWLGLLGEPSVPEICASLHAVKAALEAGSFPPGGPLAAAALWNLRLARQAAAAWGAGEAAQAGGGEAETEGCLLPPKYLAQLEALLPRV